MPLIKTLSQTLKQDKEKFKVPRSVQQAIPIRKIWPDGIFQVESKYSRTFRFTDINYSIASKSGQDRNVPGLFRTFKCTGFRLYCEDYPEQP